jgi:hypothetical protein
MQAVVRNVEEVQFGGGEATDSRFRSVMMDVLGLLNERLAAVLPFIVKLTVGLGLAGMLASCNFERGGGDRATSGRVLVWDLLKRYGFTPTNVWPRWPRSTSRCRRWCCCRARTWTTPPGRASRPGSARAGRCWWPAAITRCPTGSARRSASAQGAASTTAEPLAVSPEQADRLPQARPRSSRAIAGRRSEDVDGRSHSEAGDEERRRRPRRSSSRGKALYAVERTYDNGGRAIVLADDELINNVSLLVRDNARLVVELLARAGRKIEIAGELTGLVSKDPITSVQRGRLAPALLQLALLILLFFVYKGAHFGRPVDPMALTRRRFSEHARAVGLMYGRKRAGRHALELYGTYALEKMRERLNLSGGKSILAVAEEVAARTGRPLGDVMRVLVEARPAQPGPRRPGARRRPPGSELRKRLGNAP